MVEQCVRCGPDSTEFHTNIIADANPWASIDTLIAMPLGITIPLPNQPRGREYKLVMGGHNSEFARMQAALRRAKDEGRKAISELKRISEQDIPQSENARRHLEALDPSFKNWVGVEEGLNLRSILPESHQIFSEFERNRELENSRPTMYKEIDQLKGLALTNRKFSSQTRKWLKHKSPFMGPDFEPVKPAWTKDLQPILDEPLERKEVICLTCGMVVRTFIEIEGKLQYILERLQLSRITCEFLDKYDSAMVNWVRDDKIAKEKAKKIRQEKKLQAELETLEAQRRSAEEKLRKLQDE